MLAKKRGSCEKTLTVATALAVAALVGGTLIGGCTGLPPGGCTEDSACDDGVDCTIDSCGADGVCVNDESGCGAPGCTEDSGCNDGVDCTADSCGADGVCVNDMSGCEDATGPVIDLGTAPDGACRRAGTFRARSLPSQSPARPRSSSPSPPQDGTPITGIGAVRGGRRSLRPLHHHKAGAGDQRRSERPGLLHAGYDQWTAPLPLTTIPDHLWSITATARIRSPLTPTSPM